MTATVYRDLVRGFRRGAKKIARLRWKRAVVLSFLFTIGGFFLANGIYQVIRKPGELFAPVSAAFVKSPGSTWRSYGSIFEKHSTDIISPEFLAALAQVESDGNPIARARWRWQWSWNPFEIYRPASSALGMFQFTDGTFAEARKYCIRNRQVAADGPWYDIHSCWFNSLYSRTVPSHATEMTAAYLHRSVINTLAARPGAKASLEQKQKLAAVIHLCGAKRGESFVRQGFRPAREERCGTQSLRRYLVQVDRMKKQFVQLRKGTELSAPGRKVSLISPSS